MPSPVANDGIVPTISQGWGQIIDDAAGKETAEPDEDASASRRGIRRERTVAPPTAPLRARAGAQPNVSANRFRAQASIC